MGEFTLITFCQYLSNFTQNRCYFVENSNTCRCTGEASSSVVVSTAPDIMSSEVALIFFVLAIWLSAIGFCLSQYKSLRRLETQVHYCVSRKDPLNIGEIKIVTREQDSIIYKKKRYSTIVDTRVNSEDLKSFHYVQQYLPTNLAKNASLQLSSPAVNQDDHSDNASLPTVLTINQSPHVPYATYQEINECQSTLSYFTNDIMESNRSLVKSSYSQRKESGQFTTGLLIPYISTPNSLHSSWNDPNLYEVTTLKQHLCVPTSALRSNRCSIGNISLPVPKLSESDHDSAEEKLIDPRLIPDIVRRSLLALHRESQENVNMLKRKEKTRSENDMPGSFAAWKTKMKSKLKRTHHLQHHHTRSHSNTLLMAVRMSDHADPDQQIHGPISTHNEYQHLPSSSDHSSASLTPLSRRRLKLSKQCPTQSTSDSETVHDEYPTISSVNTSTDDSESAVTIIETSGK